MGIMDKKTIHMAAFVLTIVGALNWGLVGLLDLNLVNVLLGSWPMVERLVYIAVGVSAAYIFATHKETCKYCSQK